MGKGKIYKVISRRKSRKAAENNAKQARKDGFERVRIIKVRGKSIWEIWAFV